MDRSYKDELNIDLDDLTAELADHANRYAYWSEKFVLATEIRDKAKANLEVVKAELETTARTDWENIDDFVKSPTDKSANFWVTKHKKVKEATDKLITANKVMGIYLVAKSAFEARRKMLEALAQKEIQNWYAEPRTSELGPAKELAGLRGKKDSRLKKKKK